MSDQETDAPFSVPARERVLRGNACAGLSSEDRAALDRAAALYVDAHGLVPRMLGRIGRYAGGAIERVLAVVAPGGRQIVEDVATEALWSLLGAARFGLQSGAAPARVVLYRRAVAASGAASGFFGGPAVIADIPFAMTMMFRAIAEIAREAGEDLEDEGTRRACLEVFGFGAIRDVEADIDASYWAVRAALMHAPIEVFLRAVAGRLSITMSQAVLAGAVPVVGAFAGGGANYYFMQHFQTMAEVHFALRKIERSGADGAQIRTCFDALVEAHRRDRSLFRRAA